MIEENLFISLCASSFYLAGSELLSTNSNPILASLIFWSTLLIYQINTKLKVNVANPESFRNIEKIQKTRLIAYTILGLIVFVHLPFFDLMTITFLAHLGLLSTLYNVPKQRRRFSIFPLRSIPFLKVFLIAYVWASISSWLPAIERGLKFDQEPTYIFLAHFLFILSITLPFDIRDFKADHQSQIITVPHVIGKSGTKALALIALLLYTILLINYTGSFFALPIFASAGLLILFSSPKRKDYYFMFFVDGMIILYLIFVKLAAFQIQ